MAEEIKTWDDLHSDEDLPDDTTGNGGDGDVSNGAGDGSTGGDGASGDGAGDGADKGDNADGAAGDGAVTDGDGKGDGDGGDAGAAGDGGDGVDPHIDTKDVKLTGIEKYLSQFDIEAGMIQFEDGTSTHFKDLEPDKQAEVLSNLHDTNAKTIEEKYGLDENEVGLINYLRTNNLKVEDYIESLAQERVNSMTAASQATTEDYENMSDDAVYLKFLKESNSEATAEELEADLEKAKEQKSFEKTAKALREGYKVSQQQEIAGIKDSEAEEFSKMLEQQREEVVNTVANIDSISGITLNKDAKNSLLDQVLNVTDSGDSMFMADVFGDPEKLFNAAFWYYYGPDVFKQKETYWKAEKSRAYKLGRESALGKSSTPQNFVDKNAGDGSPADGDEYLTLEELNS